MRLIEYLVPSRARRQVLETLRSRRGPFSVRELARTTRLPYSNVQREVERLRGLGLLRTEMAGRSFRCSWVASSPAARAVTALLEVPSAVESRERDLYSSLKHWGAPLLRGAAVAAPLPLEETLARGLGLARRDPDVAQTWPVVLARQRSRVDLARLEALARRLGEKKALGFMLSMTGLLTRDAALSTTAGRLRDKRVRKPEDFFLLDRGRRSRRLSEETTPSLARKWHFRMNTPLEGFRSHFRKFVPDP